MSRIKGKIKQVLSLILLLGLASSFSLVSKNEARAAGDSAPWPYLKVAGPGVTKDSEWDYLKKHYAMSGPGKSITPSLVSDLEALYKSQGEDLQMQVYDGLSFVDTGALSNQALSKYHELYKWCRGEQAAFCQSNGGLESVYLHYAQNQKVKLTPDYNGSPPRENRFWQVINYDGTNYANKTGQAYGDEFVVTPPVTWTIPFAAGVDQALYFGNHERFSQINFNLGAFAAGGWQGVWEYYNGSGWTAVNPTSNTTTVGTQQFAQNGNVQFNPPPTETQWKTVSALQLGINQTGATAGILDEIPSYWLRLRCTNAGTGGPSWQSITKSNAPKVWVGTSGISLPKYIPESIDSAGVKWETIPGWDQANDPDNDGFAEKIANSAADANLNALALFKYQSRLRIWVFWPEQWMLDMKSPIVQQFSPQFAVRLVNAQAGGVDNMFFDVINGNFPTVDGSNGTGLYLNYSTTKTIRDSEWRAALLTQLKAVSDALHAAGKKMILNAYSSDNNIKWWDPDITNVADGLLREGAMSIYMNSSGGAISSDGSVEWLSRYGGGAWPMSPKNLDAQGKMIRYNWLDSSRDFGDRDRILGLARYLNLAYSHSYFDYGMDFDHTRWYQAMTWVGNNIGTPVGDAYVWNTGNDPYFPNATYAKTVPYYIFAREYTKNNFKRLILDRPASRYDGAKDDRSAVTWPLDRPYRPLLANQTDPNNPNSILGEPITSITLRNGEGAILIDAAETPSPFVSMTVDKSTAKPGDILTYTLTYSNPTQNTYTNARIEDQIPLGTTFVSASNGGISNGTKVIWTIGNLSPGMNVSVTMQVRVQ